MNTKVLLVENVNVVIIIMSWILLLSYLDSGIVGKIFEGVYREVNITGEVESSGDNNLAEERKLTDVAVLDLRATEMIRSWKTLGDRGDHGIDCGGRGPF